MKRKFFARFSRFLLLSCPSLLLPFLVFFLIDPTVVCLFASTLNRFLRKRTDHLFDMPRSAVFLSSCFDLSSLAKVFTQADTSKRHRRECATNCSRFPVLLSDYEYP